MEYAEELEKTLREAASKVEAGEDVKALLEEAQELLDQLKIEARTKAEKGRVSAQEARVAELRSRAALFGGSKGKGIMVAGSSQERQRLASARDRAQESSSRIQQTKEILDEIEDTGADIITELHRNRETIEKINGSVKETKGELDKADKMVTKMSKWWSRW